MSSPLALYESALSGDEAWLRVRFETGGVMPLPVGRYLGSADASRRAAA